MTIEEIREKYKNGISQSVIDLTAMDILQKGLKECNEKEIPAKPNKRKVKKRTYKANDKDIIKELKRQIKDLKEEMKKIDKELQEYTDYWNSISDEFYYNKKLVEEYKKCYGDLHKKIGGENGRRYSKR